LFALILKPIGYKQTYNQQVHWKQQHKIEMSIPELFQRQLFIDTKVDIIELSLHNPA